MKGSIMDEWNGWIDGQIDILGINIIYVVTCYHSIVIIEVFFML